MNYPIDLKNFSGVLPLFPLPNVVHFPSTVLPLHIFERRYRTMLRHVMENEKMIGMAVLKPGWEEHYEGNPDIYPIACLGTVIDHEPLADGRSNILLLGLKRVRIKEIVSPRPYRTAKVEIVEDTLDPIAKTEFQSYRKRLLDLYGELVIEFAGTDREFPTLSDAELEPGLFTDALAASLGLKVPELVALLEEHRIVKRAELLEQKIITMLKKGGPSVLPPHQYHAMKNNFPFFNAN